jgi:histidine triad (HIT) family protein
MNNRVSQSVPHLHVHVVPRRKKDGLKGFFWPRTKYKGAEEMEEVKKKIVTALKKINARNNFSFSQK